MEEIVNDKRRSFGVVLGPDAFSLSMDIGISTTHSFLVKLGSKVGMAFTMCNL
jgi:hypothetical protein